VSNSAKLCTIDQFDLVADCVPILTNILLSNKVQLCLSAITHFMLSKDKQLRDLACKTFCSLVDVFAAQPPLIDKINAHGLVLAVLPLVTDTSTTAIDAKLFIPVFKMLTKFCRCCPHIVESILTSGTLASVRLVHRSLEDRLEH
jgi:hypothetical protein